MCRNLEVVANCDSWDEVVFLEFNRVSRYNVYNVLSDHQYKVKRHSYRKSSRSKDIGENNVLSPAMSMDFQAFVLVMTHSNYFGLRIIPMRNASNVESVSFFNS